MNVSSLLTEPLTFANRGGELPTVQETFDNRALALWYNETSPTSPDDVTLLAEATRLFANPSGLPDGGAAYGISLHRMGAGVNGFGDQDENYRGGPRTCPHHDLPDVDFGNGDSTPDGPDAS